MKISVDAAGVHQSASPSCCAAVERRAAARACVTVFTGSPTLMDVIRALPPHQVRNRIVRRHPSILRGLMRMSKDSRDYFTQPYFRCTFGMRDVFRPPPRTDFRLQLPRRVVRALNSGASPGDLPHQLLALANGHVNRYLGQERFELVLALLDKELTDRKPEELQRIGIASSRIQHCYLRQDWAIIGLVNGVMDIEDFAGVDLIDCGLPQAFWSRRFPDSVGAEPLPEMLPEDWIQVGLEPSRTITLDRIRDLSYLASFHYVACVISRRMFGTPVGPFSCSVEPDRTLRTVCEIFKISGIAKTAKRSRGSDEVSWPRSAYARDAGEHGSCRIV